MHPSIGQLSNGKCYVYLNGYNSEPFMGTLEEVEAAMGLCVKAEVVPEAASKAKTFNVLLRFQYPAWDEVDGIEFSGIFARSKSEANKIARKMAANDGHLGSMKGRVTFTATEV